jgi:hypothetical protein
MAATKAGNLQAALAPWRPDTLFNKKLRQVSVAAKNVFECLDQAVLRHSRFSLGTAATAGTSH